MQFIHIFLTTLFTYKSLYEKMEYMIVYVHVYARVCIFFRLWIILISRINNCFFTIFLHSTFYSIKENNIPHT